MGDVHAYLEEASKKPWRWGGGKTGADGQDCTLFAADWALFLTGEDPGVGIRGSYSTEEEALAIVARAGGMDAFVDQQLRPQGWIRISAAARDGDIAVVLAPQPPHGVLGPVPAIMAGGLWVGRSVRGQVAHSFKPTSVWRWQAGPLADLGPPAPYFPPPMSRQEMSGDTMFTPLPRQMQQTGIIESFILLGLTSIGVSGAALNILTPLLTSLAITGVSMGVNTLLAAAFAPKPPSPEDGKAPKTQPIPPRIYAFGRNRISGYYMLWEAKNDRLYAVLALVGHAVNAFVGFYMHDDPVDVSAPPNLYYSTMGSASMTGSDGRYSQERIAIETRLGAVPSTAFQGIVDELSASGAYTTDWRLDGTAALAMICRAPEADEFQKIFPNQLPQPSEVIETALCYDPRDPAQDPDDPSTHVYTENAALGIMWFYCFCPFGPKLDYHKVIEPVVDIWIEEADICDEAIPRAAGGTEPRYHCHVWLTTDHDRKAMLNAMLNACDGWFVRRGDGCIELRVGKFREELVETITDDDIAGYYLANDVEEENEVNRLVPKFNYPATDYTTTDTDYFEDLDAQLLAGEILPMDSDLSAVQEWRQARRLAWREWQRLQMKRRGTLNLFLSGINAAYARWVRVQSTRRVPRLNGALIENRRSVLALMKGGYSLEFVEHPENIDTWVPETMEGRAPPVPIKPSNDGIEEVVFDTLTAIASGGSVYLRAVIVEPITDDLIPILFYRIKDIGGGTPGEWIEQRFPDSVPAAGLIILNTHNVIPDTIYQVQGAFQATGGSKSDRRPTIPLEVTTTLYATPTAAPTLLSATPSGSDIDLTAKAPNSALHKAIHYWRADESQAFGAATDLGAVFGPPNGVAPSTDTPGDGSWQYWATAANLSDVHSASVGPELERVGLETETVTFLNAVTSKLDQAHVLAVDALIAGLKTDGIYSKIRWLSLFCLPTQQAGLLNLVNPSETATVGGTVTFHTNAGVESNGTTGYIGTGVLANAAGVLTTNGLHLLGWFNGGTGTALSNTALVGVDSGSNTLFLCGRGSTTTMSSRANASVTLTSTLSVNTPAGFSLANRSGASARENYRSGVLLSSDTQAATTLPVGQLCFLRHLTNYAATGHIQSIGGFGGSLSGTEEANYNSRLATFRTAMGL